MHAPVLCSHDVSLHSVVNSASGNTLAVTLVISKLAPVQLLLVAVLQHLLWRSCCDLSSVLRC